MRTAVKKYGTLSRANQVFAFVLALAFVYVLVIFMSTFDSGRLSSSTDSDVQTHGKDDHRDLLATDEIIVVLGYKLHPDGMATRILRDRVERAAQLYKELMYHRHHPLIIVSGKGKSEDIGFTEAEVMMELLTFFGVRKTDIMVDENSANTAQNAKFSAALIKGNKAIKEVYVVTSDYHSPRAQYIFQTVFPSNIKLEFVSSETSEKKRNDEAGRERTLLKSSQDDLIAEEILEDSESYGYHPLRNYPRWQMIDRELENDIREGVNKGKKISVVDYGSNYGYFSLHFAQKFPSATVISLEGEAYTEYDGAPDVHAKKMKELDVHNNFLCRTLVTPSMFTTFYNEKLVYTYQLTLSVFHWFRPMDTREMFEDALGHHLMNARTTFIELPEAMHYKGDEGQHEWKKVNKWYNGRNETQIMDELGERYGFKATYKFLGPILHATGTVRKVIRVDLQQMKPNFDKDKILETYKCKQVNGGK